MGKNVAVFVDVANIFYAAKAAGVDIDYVTLLKTASAGRDLVRAYAYTGLDPDNENQRNFHDFLRRHGYKVVSKDIRKYGDGKVKANLDIELVVDMLKTARNLDIAIVISGDGDFAPAIRAVQEMGVRVEVISFRGNTSSDLIDVADQFTEITNIARVEKGSSRSGRRVAGDDEDLSMTEVPEKQSEGAGARDRGRGRGRGRPVEAEPVAASRSRRVPRSRAAVAGGEPVVAVTSDGMPLVVLPGEKLSRAAAIASTPAIAGTDEDEPGLDEVVEGPAGDATETGGEEARRRRRRRGGRGRGRGRARGVEEPIASSGEGPGSSMGQERIEDEDETLEPIPAPAPAKRPAFAFGSVWDSQIGMPTSSSGGLAPIADEEDLDEPPIPEYLIAERRQRGGRGQAGGRGQVGGRGAAGRGTRGAYAAALDRERYGGGRGSSVSRFAEPAPRGPREDRSQGGRIDDRTRADRSSSQPAPRSAPRSGSGDEPWSEVPPEIEAMLRAQLGGRDTRPARPAAKPQTAPVETDSGATPIEPALEAKAAAPKRRTTRQAAARGEASPVPAVTTTPAEPAVRSVSAEPAAETAAPKRRAARRAAVPAEPAAETAAPKSRTARRTAPGTDAVSAAEAAVAEAGAPAAEATAPKRRSSRKKADAPDA